MFQMYFQPNNPLWGALEKKGFKVKRVAGPFPEQDLMETDQLWIVSCVGASLGESKLKAIEHFVWAGKGLYLLADNTPWLYEANVLAQRMYGARVQADYLGTKIAYVKERNLSREDIVKYRGDFAVPDHPLLTGINFMYEGITISYVTDSDKLEVAIRASDNKPLVVLSKKPGERVLIDCGWTRYAYGSSPGQQFITMTSGTLRFAENVAAYLQGKGR